MLDTQEMIANITPFVFSTVKKSTVVHNNINSRPTPSTVTKARNPVKSKKRASFMMDEASSGSSQGSLKAIMKVAKSGSMMMTSQQKPHLVRSNGNPDDSLNQNSVESWKMDPPSRSILKSSLAPSTEHDGYSTKAQSSSFKHDAQRFVTKGAESVSKVFDDVSDEFDLDAAIDDLGSFLGNWDAEKEAAEFNVQN
jgi:hypothetical protein